MKISVVANNKDECKNFEKTLISKLDGCSVNDKNPDVCFSVGGDGTFLYMVHKFGFNTYIHYAGFNLGTVGFLTSFSENDVDKFRNTSLEKFYVDKYSYLNIEIKNKSGIHKYKALNEVVVRNFVSKASRFEVFANNEKLEDFVGDALVVATPIGSSAYNYNLGGPLIYDKIDSLILNSLAPINNSVYKSINNAVLFDKSSSIIMKPIKDDDIYFIMDGFEKNLKDVEYVKISLSKKKLKVLRFKKVSYSELIHNKLL